MRPLICCICSHPTLPGATPLLNHWDGERAMFRHVACSRSHHRAKLTANEVRQIRKLYASGGWSFKKLGREFGVSDANISLIVHRDTWRHVGMK